MSRNIRFKRGNSTDLPTSAPAGTPLWCTDTHELYIGTGNSVAKITSASGSGGGSSNVPQTSVEYDSENQMLVFSAGNYSSPSYSKTEIDSLIGDIESLLREV